MTVVYDLLFALVLGAVLSVLLVKVFHRQGPGPLRGFLTLFILLFLISWAGGLWLAPITSPYWEVPWLEFAVVGFIVLLLLAAVLPPRPAGRAGPDATTPAEAEAEAFLAFGAIFWIVAIVLVGSIIASYHAASVAQKAQPGPAPSQAPVTTRDARGPG